MAIDDYSRAIMLFECSLELTISTPMRPLKSSAFTSFLLSFILLSFSGVI